MYAESDLLPLSGIQHLLYCERQWALIHIEQQWVENKFTASGRALHRVVDEAPDESHSGVRIVRSLALRSLRLGLTGKADVVEFPLSRDGPPLPVEYKRGRAKPGPYDEVQLCAQALCLEEMLGASIREGALFYGTPRRRTRVLFSPELRSITEKAAARMHELYAAGRSPAPQYAAAKCDKCSLIDICCPRGLEARGGGDGASQFLFAAIARETKSVAAPAKFRPAAASAGGADIKSKDSA
jgi:CRISPR-associated exonuclease Cas4